MLYVTEKDLLHIKNEDLHGPVVECLGLFDAVQRLCKSRLTNDDRIMLWSLHDAYVDHEQRDAVSRHEALLIIESMMRLMPVTVLREHNNALEYLHLGLDEAQSHDAINGFVWCSTYLPFDKSAPCATCIADESAFPELIAMIEGALNIE
jgi:hypothetical protein